MCDKRRRPCCCDSTRLQSIGDEISLSLWHRAQIRQYEGSLSAPRLIIALSQVHTCVPLLSTVFVTHSARREREKKRCGQLLADIVRDRRGRLGDDAPSLLPTRISTLYLNINIYICIYIHKTQGLSVTVCRTVGTSSARVADVSTATSSLFHKMIARQRQRIDIFLIH